MQRITITIDDDLLQTVDALAEAKGYATRSEAIREMLRGSAARTAATDENKSCVAVLSYVYDHHTRALAQRITGVFHDHFELAVSNMHVHLDHDSCLEISVLSGAIAQVRALADEVTSQRGVRHAALKVLPDIRYFRNPPQP